VIQLETAKTLGVAVSPRLSARMDDIIGDPEATWMDSPAR
jgi:hypothetical protein